MQSRERAPSVVAAVFRDGEVVWRGAVGNAELARPEPATPAHAYRIGSITKTFTAVCILQLRDAGALALDDPLRAHVPGGSDRPDRRRRALAPEWSTAGAAGRGVGVARAADARGAHRRARGRRAGLDARRGVALLEPRLRPARRGGRAARGAGLRARAADESARPARARGDGVRPARPPRDRVLRRPLQRRRDGRARPSGRGPDSGDGLALVDRRRPRPLGRLPRHRPRGRPRAGDARRDGACAGDGRSRLVGGRLGARPRSLPSRQSRLRRARGRDAGVPRRRCSSTGASAPAPPCSATRAPAPGPTCSHSIWPRRRSRRSCGRRDSGSPTRAHRRRWRRCSACGGRRARSSCSAGEASASRSSCRPGLLGRNVSWLAQEGEDRWRVVEGRELGEQLRVTRDEAGEPVRLYLATYPLTRAPTAFADSSVPSSSRSPAA